MIDNLRDQILEICKKFRDPGNNQVFDDNNKNLNIVINDKKVNLTINIDPSNHEKYSTLTSDLKAQINNLDQSLSVNIVLTSEKKITKSKPSKNSFNINAKKIIAIASGKGGVGKSTFAINFAMALKKLNKKVGLLDADIYGPSIPKMIGLSERPERTNDNKMIPLEKYGLKCMSIGFLISEDTPAIWRGPMVMKALEQMFNGVEWGDLDFLIIDLPPGTGDAQLTLAQHVKLDGSIIVSTPQDIALIDARKGINMFKKVGVEVMGIVENMSYFICEKCDERHEIFSNGGAKKEAEKYKTTFLGEIPINKNLRINSDEGIPMIIADPENEITNKYLSIAEKIIFSLN